MSNGRFSFVGLGLLVSVALLPVYLWSSGGMQLAHYAAFLLIVTTLLQGGVSLKSIHILYLALVAIVAVREAIALSTFADIRAFEPVAHVIFTALYLNTFARLVAQDALIKFVIAGVLLSACVAVLGVLALGYSLSAAEGISRSVGTFNNPNQLAYFAVCLSSIGYLLMLHGRIGGKALLFIVATSLFLSAVSLSKAGLISVLVASVVGLFAFGPKRYRLAVGALAAVTAVTYIAYTYQAGSLDEFAAVQRLQSIGQQEDDALGTRGYALFHTATATELLFGLSYLGVVDRIGHEVHSTLFYFFATYGAFAGILFVSIVGVWARVVWLTHGVIGLMLCVVPPMLYGITHNGTRFTIFWLLVSLTLGLYSLSKQRAESARGGVRAGESMQRPASRHSEKSII